MKVERPKTFKELKDLVEAHLVEVMIEEDSPDGTTHFLVCNSRRTYEEGEIYELHFSLSDIVKSK